MSTQKLKNRWLIAVSAVGIHISIGSVYAYSVMTNPVKDIFDVDGSVIKWAFKIAILLLGLSAAFLGRWVEKVGPKISGTTAGIFYGVGILGSGLAVQLESLDSKSNPFIITQPEFMRRMKEMQASGLRGRGGGGFSTGLKWNFAYNNDILHCWSFHCRIFN